ncbi:MAG TPA: hypothetical protein VIG99_17815 [Myxococcaceae bacterium]
MFALRRVRIFLREEVRAMRVRRSRWFGSAPVALFSLGVLVGAAWRRRTPGGERTRRPSMRTAGPPKARSLTPEQAWQPGAERASVIGYERAPAPPPSPEPEAPGGAPGHRILNG